jgi:hypothetical protein
MFVEGIGLEISLPSNERKIKWDKHHYRKKHSWRGSDSLWCTFYQVHGKEFLCRALFIRSMEENLFLSWVFSHDKLNLCCALIFAWQTISSHRVIAIVGGKGVFPLCCAPTYGAKMTKNHLLHFKIFLHSLDNMWYSILHCDVFLCLFTIFN